MSQEIEFVCKKKENNTPYTWAIQNKKKKIPELDKTQHRYHCTSNQCV